MYLSNFNEINLVKKNFVCQKYFDFKNAYLY